MRSSPANGAGGRHNWRICMKFLSLFAILTIPKCWKSQSSRISSEADLNAIEALGFRQLMTRFGHTQEKLAEALSRSRSHVADLLRLLTLPSEVQDMVGRGAVGRARAGADRQPERIGSGGANCRQGLSVRETERLVKAEAAMKPAGKPAVRLEKDADTGRWRPICPRTLRWRFADQPRFRRW